jgi:hypothetical protein
MLLVNFLVTLTGEVRIFLKMIVERCVSVLLGIKGQSLTSPVGDLLK